MAIAGNKLLNLSGAKVLYDDLRARIEGALAAGETSPAAAAHAAGEVIVVDGHLYKVTAAIAAGDTIAATGAGANVTAATVAELIAAIDMTDLIDDTAGDGTTDKTWSVDKILDAVAALIDDTAGDGDTGKTWSADKITGALSGVSAIISIIMADEETGTTASRAYAKGEFFVKDGALYITKEAINSGDTFGSENSEEKTLAGALLEKADKDTPEINGSVLFGTFPKSVNRTFSSGIPEWQGNGSSYIFGSTVWKKNGTKKDVYMCVIKNNDAEWDSNKWWRIGSYMSSQTIELKWNDLYLEQVGNGTMSSDKQNARILDKQGNEWLAGSLTLGNTTLTEARLQALLALLNT